VKRILCNFTKPSCKHLDASCNFTRRSCKHQDASCNLTRPSCKHKDALCNFTEGECIGKDALCNFAGTSYIKEEGNVAVYPQIHTNAHKWWQVNLPFPPGPGLRNLHYCVQILAFEVHFPIIQFIIFPYSLQYFRLIRRERNVGRGHCYPAEWNTKRCNGMRALEPLSRAAVQFTSNQYSTDIRPDVST
jgi:hypothetical protein